MVLQVEPDSQAEVKFEYLMGGSLPSASVGQEIPEVGSAVVTSLLNPHQPPSSPPLEAESVAGQLNGGSVLRWVPDPCADSVALPAGKHGLSLSSLLGPQATAPLFQEGSDVP